MISTFLIESVDKHRAALIGKELKTTLAGYTYVTHLAYKKYGESESGTKTLPQADEG
jgi:hypothetical protein